MRLALFSGALTRNPSFTDKQEPPEWFRWVSPFEDHVASVGTVDGASSMYRSGRGTGIPSVLWRVESRWLERYMEASRAMPPCDLIVSNQEEHVTKGASYLPLFGTTLPDIDIPEKTEIVSMIASAKRHADVEGYGVRATAAVMLGGDGYPHGYGKAFRRPILSKWPALAPYRFSIAIESEAYPWWHTEKLFDCFATKTVPIYWGCDDFSKLAEFGYDPVGIIPWNRLDELSDIMRRLDEETYSQFAGAIETNYRVTRENYCVEIPLARLLREKLGI